MTVLLSPLFNPDSAQIDANGDPRTGGKLFTYLAGTSTKTTTYKENTGSTAHANPIVLDSNGLPPAPIWLTAGAAVKFVLAPSTDSDPPVSAILTIDNVSAVNDTAAAATSTEWTASGMTPTYISATSFSVAGDQTTALHVGRRLKITVTAGTVYATIIKSAYTSLTTVTVLTDSGSVDSGISAFSYGIASADNTSLPFISRDQQCGRLVYVSATQIRLDPQDGNTIWVYSGSNWRRRIIPSAGITVANTGLAANTAYFVYLYDNAGVLTLEFSSATAPAVDATSGLKIKTGDATRLLVGMVRTQGSTPGQFQTPALVLSWYKRRGITASASLSTNRTQNSTSAIELNAEIEAKFLSWAEETVLAQFTGYATTDTLGKSHTTYITLDGIVTAFSPIVSVNTPVVSNFDNVSVAGHGTVTEGYHYVTIAVYVQAGTNLATWASGSTLYVLTRG
jgi:hypothetical protein